MRLNKELQTVYLTEVVKPANVKSVDPKQLQMGIKVEMEHTNSKEKAKKIALAEDPKYYSKLKQAKL